MIMPAWKLLPLKDDHAHHIVMRKWDDGRQESCFAYAVKSDFIGGAELQDADGNVMTAEQVQEFLATLP